MAAVEPAHEPLLRLDRVVKSFGDNLVLDGIDLEVASGEVLVVIGPSGGGKSTLLRCVNLGLEEIDRGQIAFDDQVYIEARPGARRRTFVARPPAVGMVFQQFNLFPHLTVLENITLAPRGSAAAAPRPRRGRALLARRPRGQADVTRSGSRVASSSGLRSRAPWRWIRG